MMVHSLPLISDLLHAQTGVVPVVAQAGTALAPLLALALTSALGLLMRPRELLALLRRKSWILVCMGAFAGLLWATWVYLHAAGQLAAPSTHSRATVGVDDDSAQTDWAAVALAIIRAQEASAHAGAVAVPAASAAEAAAPISPPTIGTDAVALSFRGGATRSGHLGGPSPVGLTPAWSYYAQDDHSGMVLSSPIVHDGLVFSASCVLRPPTSLGAISCVELSSGRERWSTTRLPATTDSPNGDELIGFFSSPALTADGRRLLIGQGLHADYDAHLLCLDASNGAVLWTIHTPVHLESSPSIEGDIVVIGAGAVEVGPEHRPVGNPAGRGNPGFVLGARISTGETLFRYPINDPEGSPVLKDGICYIGSGLNGSRVVALRADRSDSELQALGLDRVLWSSATPFPGTGAVTLVGDTVLMGCGKGDFVYAAKDPEGVVLALDCRTGATRWSVAMPDAVLGPIAVADGVAIVPCRNGEVTALDLAANGALRWRARIHKQSPVLAGPAIANGLVYAVSSNGWLGVFALADGTQRERIYLNAKGRPGELSLCTSAPLIVGGRLLVGSETGGLRCFLGTLP